MGNKVGSMKRVSLDGFDYPVFNDSDTSKKPPVTNEVLQTSGGGIPKQTVNTPSREGITIGVPTAKKLQQLEYSAEKGENIKMFIEYRNGDIDHMIGTFNIDESTSMDGKATVNLLPTEPVVPQSS